MSVSIIIPVYNVAPYLRTSLDSLSVQTYADWTAICVDDGSDDGSAAILDAYAARDSRFQVFHQAHAGVSAARNRGLDEAKGDFVAFLDPDDEVMPEWLARMVAALAENDWLLAGFTENGQVRASFDEGVVHRGVGVRRRAWRAFFGYRLRDLLGLFLPGGLWRRCHREMAGVWRCLVRREVLADVRFDERLHLYEDAMFLSKLGLRARSLIITADCGYRWQVRSTGAMSREMRERLLQNKFAVRDVRAEMDPAKSHWRGTFLLSAIEVLTVSRSLRVCWRYLRFGPLLM